MYLEQFENNDTKLSFSGALRGKKSVNRRHSCQIQRRDCKLKKTDRDGAAVFELENVDIRFSIAEEKVSEEIDLLPLSTAIVTTPSNEGRKKRIRTSNSGNKLHGGVSFQDRDRLSRKERVTASMIKIESEMINDLETLLNEFQKPMLNLAGDLGLSSKDVTALFCNSDNILRFHQMFLQQFTKKHLSFTKICLKNMESFKLHSQYLNSLLHSIDLLVRNTKNTKFQAFLSEMRQSEACKGRDITYFLMAPIQLIPAFQPVLRELKKHTLPADEDFQELQQVFEKIQKVYLHITENKPEVEHLCKLLEIDSRLGHSKEYIGFEIVTQDRFVVSKSLQCVSICLFS